MPRKKTRESLGSRDEANLSDELLRPKGQLVRSDKWAEFDAIVLFVGTKSLKKQQNHKFGSEKSIKKKEKPDPQTYDHTQKKKQPNKIQRNKRTMNLPPQRFTMYQFFLVMTALFNNLVFGFVLLFAIVIMPGLSSLPNDVAFLQGFQAIDGMIQNNQPIFVLTWMGSFLTLVLWAVLEFRSSRKVGITPFADLGVTFVGLVGHAITFAGNIPLNNQVHNLDLNDDSIDYDSISQERTIFEQPWNVYNNIRTVLFGFVSIYLLIKLSRHEPKKAAIDLSSEEVAGDCVPSSLYTSYQNSSAVV